MNQALREILTLHTKKQEYMLQVGGKANSWAILVCVSLVASKADETITLYLTFGFSASLSSDMLESASGGRISTRAFEWR